MHFGQVEGTDIQVLDPRFKRMFAGWARVERLWTGARWSEGPVWFPAGRCLIWSDIPNNRMLRWIEESGAVSVFRAPSNHSNGNTIDNQGRLVTCEHLTRRVTRTEIDGSVAVVADRWQGRRLNSPNDVVVKSDDSVWFSDPSYGIDTDNEGARAEPEIDGCHVYRVDPGGAVERVIDDMVRPNGLAFSPDARFLYVSDTGATHRENGPRHILRFAVSADGRSVSGGEAFAESTSGVLRRLPGRPAGPDLDELRGGRPLLRSGRDADRQDSRPRDRRQRHFRRRQAQPPVHLRHELALCGHPDDQRRPARLKCANGLDAERLRT